MLRKYTFADSLSGGRHSARHRLRGNIRRHDGARGQLGEADLQGTRLSEAEDHLAPRGWPGDYRTRRTTGQNKRLDFRKSSTGMRGFIVSILEFI